MDMRTYHVRPDGLQWYVVETTIYDSAPPRETDKFGPYTEKYLAQKEADRLNAKEGL